MEGQEGTILNIDEFEILFRRNHKFLCMVAMDYVQDQYLAEDVVQDFFIDFWQRRHTIKLTSSFEGYARRAIKYKSIDLIRKNAVAEKGSHQFLKLEIEEGAEPEPDQVDRQHQRYLKIVELIHTLPENRRNIFIMHAVDKLSYAQIAEKQQISINTVKTQLKRAYAAIRGMALLLFLLFLWFIHRL
ncbi:RNA polymerase sigma factor [Pedobacter sp. AW31-3R]|uniref:RNA polymerase sigma factor n=1 Tax=Pedobacter sp. AW31-3R TaxID=3445781 RepID=UPI003F9F2D3E